MTNLDGAEAYLQSLTVEQLAENFLQIFPERATSPKEEPLITGDSYASGLDDLEIAAILRRLSRREGFFSAVDIRVLAGEASKRMFAQERSTRAQPL